MNTTVGRMENTNIINSNYTILAKCRIGNYILPLIAILTVGNSISTMKLVPFRT